MGHYEETLTGRGKTKQEALSDALDQFWYDNGHDYSISRHISAQQVACAAPMGWVQVKETIPAHYDSWHRWVGAREVVRNEYQPDYHAKPSEWDQVWEFVIDFYH